MQPTQPFFWAINPTGVVVPSHTWTPIPWTMFVVNGTPVSATDDGGLVFPAPFSEGLWAACVQIAWDNSGRPMPHRKLVRFAQTLDAPGATPRIIGAASSLLYVPVADAGLPTSDGTAGYQQQQCYLQPGFPPGAPSQRLYVEVYQDSHQTLMCPFDGSYAPGGSVYALQAPSLMVAKVYGW